MKYNLPPIKTVVASGYFDPLHVGHIELLEKAKALGDWLIVVVNNNRQAESKKGKAFMSEEDRVKIVSSLRCVDQVFLAIDKDDSVCESLTELNPDIFANGGDRFNDEVAETKVCKDLGIEIVDGLGEKIRSSSELVRGSESATNTSSHCKI
jgi:cytidyltransferase-like protein